jgi:hypothetical protein
MHFRTSLIALASVFSIGNAVAGTTTIAFNESSAASSAVQFSGNLTASGLYTDSGVTLTGLLDASVYSLSFSASLDYVGSWRKLVDFQGLGEDTGLYLHDGQLAIYLGYQVSPSLGDTLTGTDTVQSNEPVTVSLTRTAEGLVTASLNNVVQFSFSDLFNKAVFMTSSNGQTVVNILRDDTVTVSEQGTGTLHTISLTSEGSPDLNLPMAAAVPEPESMALAAVGLVTALGVARRRQRRG